jgi:small subunit ribosomal protein S19
MPRSATKGPFVDHHLLKKVQEAVDTSSNKPIKTYSRRSCILPMFVGLKFLVHNGKTFVPVYITKEMVGMVLGMFALTRIFRQHAGDRKK